MESSMVEELVCPICLSLFQEPQMLCCGHNFCLSCLDSCFPGGQNNGKCPECRCSFSRQGFMCNRVLANLAEKARKLQLNQEPQPAVSAEVGLCKEHNEPLKLCCKQDLVPICGICRDLPQHQGHNFLPTKSAEKYTKTSHEDILSQISTEFEVFHQILNEKEQDLKKTVEEKKTENMLQEVEDAIGSLKEEVPSNTEINTRIKTAFQIADYFAFFRDFKQLIERVKEFQIWKAKDDDDASMREEVKPDEGVAQHGEEQHGHEVNIDEDEDDLSDWDVDVDTGDGQVSEEEADPGDWEIEDEDNTGRGIAERGRGGIWRNSIRDVEGSWRWRSLFQREEWRWGSILRGGGWRLGINRRRGWRWGTNQRRTGGWRVGSIQRRGGGRCH